LKDAGARFPEKDPEYKEELEKNTWNRYVMN
jgi:hypothetical protein